MPSARLHKALATLYGVPDSRAVDRILDSTASAHGPRHRKDPVHSLTGAAKVLASRGQLTPENLRAAVVHLTADRMLDELMAGTKLRGERRKVVKAWVELQMADGIERKRP